MWTVWLSPSHKGTEAGTPDSDGEVVSGRLPGGVVQNRWQLARAGHSLVPGTPSWPSQAHSCTRSVIQQTFGCPLYAKPWRFSRENAHLLGTCTRVMTRMMEGVRTGNEKEHLARLSVVRAVGNCRARKVALGAGGGNSHYYPYLHT